ncbi:MAG: DNA-binding protein [Hymenobacter sp.]|nr:MAG: DNA-binding protein [Hymenobacter sp.]
MSKHPQTGLTPPLLEPASSTPPPYVTVAFQALLAALDQRIREAASEYWARYQASQRPESTPPPADELLTVEKTAALLDVVPQTILGWRQSGILIGYRMGNRVYFKRAEVIAALQAQRIPTRRRQHGRQPAQPKAR